MYIRIALKLACVYISDTHTEIKNKKKRKARRNFFKKLTKIKFTLFPVYFMNFSLFLFLSPTIKTDLLTKKKKVNK